ncbi:MAG: DUF4199 domain-containing protein [Bacteroidota bacterium]
MKRNVLIFGLVLGTILASNALYMVNIVYHNPSFEGNDVIGYAAMIVVFSLTFFGIRNYRNKDLNGVISLGKAFKAGALIALLGSTIYVVSWLFYYYLVVPDFMEKYGEHMMSVAVNHGANAAQLAEKEKEVAQFKELYRSPFFVIIISYAEVFPIGLLIAFVSALILKKKPAN